jgi:signal transduction histidine kinase
MTSMTDITEPTRIREQLSASYERFTTVLEALDAAVSVAPLGSEELLFANKLYRLWFGSDTVGHLGMVAQAGVPASNAHDEGLDDVDPFAGLPIDSSPPPDRQQRNLRAAPGQVARGALALPDLGRRPPGADGDRHRHHAAPRCRGAGGRAGRPAQAASRLITMGEMASSVAHELNQPLTAITNYCNGMMSRIKGQQIIDTEALLAALEKTSKQAQRAGQIIQRIRSFVKRSEPNRTPADVA